AGPRRAAAGWICRSLRGQAPPRIRGDATSCRRRAGLPVIRSQSGTPAQHWKRIWRPARSCGSAFRHEAAVYESLGIEPRLIETLRGRYALPGRLEPLRREDAQPILFGDLVEDQADGILDLPLHILGAELGNHRDDGLGGPGRIVAHEFERTPVG